MTNQDPQPDLLTSVATSLAAAHGASLRKRGGRGMPAYRFRRRFDQVFEHLGGLDTADLEQVPGIEWLLDNDHVVKDAIAVLERSRPRDGYRKLPTLTGSVGKGQPRILVLANEILNVRGPPLDLNWVRVFLDVYQQDGSLSLAELWALPTMLRYLVLERLINTVESALAETGTAILSRTSHGTMVASLIISLRSLAAEDWTAFIEAVSTVHRILGTDPAGAYRQMDQDTRNRYRYQVEVVARLTSRSETDVARQIIALCEDQSDTAPVCRRHVGYYLLDRGRLELITALNRRRLWSYLPWYWCREHLSWGYVASISAAGLGLLWGVGSYLVANASLPVLLVAIPVAMLLVLSVAVDGVNWLAGLTFKPRVLPKMDFTARIPAEYTTAVVTPALLTSDAGVAQLLQRMELNYLGNRDRALRYVLLSDFIDADDLHQPADDAVLSSARQGIESLNDRYGSPSLRPFLLFHRQRQWNPAEGCYMGWERKRGKLSEFNQLVLGDDGKRANLLVGDIEDLRQCRFVITLDADTQLTPKAAHKLIATLAHPLNQPAVDAEPFAVRTGYTIVQPRLEVDPAVANRNWFTRTFAGDVVLDLYSHAVSDVYQDLFRVGNFAGKGIYDVQMFEHSVAGRVPENSILSHDLFEGLHGRVALATDIILFEDYPDNLIAYARRSHRWIRGDWQLLPWLFPTVPVAAGQRARNRFTFIDRCKLLDNLRRSLFGPAALLALALSWTVLPGKPWLWTLGILGATLAPILLSSLHALSSGIAQRGTLQSFAEHLYRYTHREVARWLCLLAFLPYESYVALNAACRTLWRLLVTRRHLLQWVQAAQSASQVNERLSQAYFWREMITAPMCGLFIGSLVWLTAPQSLLIAWPFLIGWLVAPVIAHAGLQAPDTGREAERQITEADRRLLRQLALRTWQFFEQFSGPDNHWLPPDNYHEAPEIFLSRRTSPTNIGMMLLATLTAYDLGYIGPSTLSLRLRYVFETLNRLERHRGHYLNWYQLTDLNALQPRYVSTVDSGNLAASLIALRSALLEIPHRPVSLAHLTSGLVDVLHDLADIFARLLPAGGSPDHFRERVNALIAGLEETPPGDTWLALLRRIETSEIPDVQSRVLEFVSAHGARITTEDLNQIRRGFNLLGTKLRACQRESTTLLPWLEWPDSLGSAASSEINVAFRRLKNSLSLTIELKSIPACCSAADRELARLGVQLNPDLADRLSAIRLGLQEASRNAAELLASIQASADAANKAFIGMDFSFLYDRRRHLLRLGYNLNTGEFDPNYYDLLASEARLASFIAITKNDIPNDHWLHLGRPFARIGGKRSLVSWSATAFEYLMPPLLMRSPPETLLTTSCRIAVEQQQAFGKRMDVPWGISESGYYQIDKQAHYQYRAFGIPRLGLRLETTFRLVVAPYASALALPFAPRAVIDNFEQLIDLHMLGRFGLFEAVDFGADEDDGARRPRIVRSYMSHHQGMILAAINNALTDGELVRRFHADPSVASHTHLLYEQIPTGAAESVGWRPDEGGERKIKPTSTLESWSFSAQTRTPQLNVLANDHYQVILSHAGLGSSSWNGVCLSRWQPDPCDVQGTCLYLKDLDAGTCWSAGAQPIPPTDPNDCDVNFYPHMAEFHRRDHGIHLTLAVTVPASDDVEIRRVTLTNNTDRTRRILLVNYAEPVLAKAKDHERHPAFDRLFVETMPMQAEGVIMLRRRPRGEDDHPIYFAHAVTEFNGRARRTVRFHDRREFLGRNGSMRSPAGLARSVDEFQRETSEELDPITAIGMEVELPARAVTQVAFTFAVGHKRDEVLTTLTDYQSFSRVDWAFQQARVRSQRILAELDIEPARVVDVLDILSGVMAIDPGLRAPSQTLATSREIQSTLWSRGISGDLPILLLHVRSFDDIVFAEAVVRAHCYLDRQRIALDLVMLDSEIGGYAQPTRTRLSRIVEESRTQWQHYSQGSIFIVAEAEITHEDRQRLLAGAWMVLDPGQGTIAEQCRALRHVPDLLPPFVPTPSSPVAVADTPALARPSHLQFDNGWGGFSPDGREYVIFLANDDATPAPWSNVIANPQFGSLVSETGASTTWSGNSGENRLTPWYNDPVCNPSGEAIFLRDEETGVVWSPTPQPAPDQLAYLIRHGAGYSIFNHNCQGLEQTLRVFVDRDDPVKLAVVRLANHWNRPRRITVTYFAEWVLGTHRQDSRPYVVSTIDWENSALYAYNSHARVTTRTAFLAASVPIHGATADRQEFLGTDGDRRNPEALYRIGLSDTARPGADPCAALQVHADIAPGAAFEMHFILGEGRDEEHAAELVRNYRTPAASAASWQRARSRWSDLLETLQVDTPDSGLDVMVNHWLLYQSLTCRIWARTALYQSGGGYGFRDQLQDVMAFAATQQTIAREHIIRAAGVQFHQGDVLHWWHEQPLRGVRTRCSDDMLWLAYATAHYVAVTDDESILYEMVAYLDAPELSAEEDERYAEYPSTLTRDSIYAHCCRAIERADRRGAHGLPLIGTGDWNDGLNRVGSRGKGESVWLAWFLSTVYRDFAVVCERMGDAALAGEYLERAGTLVNQVELVGWDGQWYLRAFDDDGHPLGSAENEECMIDLNAQTWAALAGTPNRAHQTQAMRSAEHYLMNGIVRLLTPPFRRARNNPGYIMGYPPGVRENGAQYSHAAVWAGWAYGALGDGDRALGVFQRLNPIRHADSEAAIARYRVEPYVVAADIYGAAPYAGRGGWTWYTGAAAWTYRLAVEVILGIHRRGQTLVINPCLPAGWTGYSARLRVGNACYELVVAVAAQDGGDRTAQRVYVDDIPLPGNVIELSHDGKTHKVLVTTTSRPQNLRTTSPSTQTG